ncbi:hypothetical protein Mgra_00006867 [Meloidogyne graminicola]|uniref:Cytochrome P450 n=1 Tax=Meloidogyne graminicola TaxID=189291 RepID=A0A8S9ZKI3_9BILA|nr:hypothetical protein Mgra_00006867 [Meloidogyne graminicola]
MLLILLIFALFLFLTALKRNNYWKNRGIPGPEPLPFKGNIDLIFGKNPLALQLQRWSKIYGNIYGIKYGNRNVLVISEPVMVKELLFDKFENMYGHLVNPMIGNVNTTNMVHLFASKGRRWKRLRYIANPAFSTFNLKRVLPIIDDTIQYNIKQLKNNYKPGEFINLLEYFTNLTFNVIYRITMGKKDSKEFCQLSVDTLKRFNNNIFDYISYIFPWIGKNVFSHFINYTGKIRRDPPHILIEKIYEAVNQRKKEKIEKNRREEEEEEENDENLNKKWKDFIDLFLESEAENNTIELKNYTGTFNRAEKVEKNERKNTLDEIVVNIFLFLLTGFDTTANTLSLISHNLVMYPNVQKKLYEEIEEICGLEEGEMPTYEQLNKLKYLDAIFNETQRLCPIAAAVVNRVCEETTTLGNITIEKGTAISVDLFTLHRNKNIWGEDSEQFKPERWLNEEGNKIKNLAFYPFGGGPRICIGMRLGIMEAKMILVQLLRTFELKRCSETEVFFFINSEKLFKDDG